MPSAFPGMDPFIEGQRWTDFHYRLITALGDALVPHILPGYDVRVEERVYLEPVAEERPAFVRPDVAVLDRETREVPSAGTIATTTAAAIEPTILTLRMPERHREIYLVIRDLETMAVVTVIEVLSPSNKERGSSTYREYFRKRNEVPQSEAHLVELDLRRGGARLPTIEPLPPGDYYACVGRAERRPEVEVYAWPLRHPLPPIPVPLKEGEADVVLDLQDVFTTVFDRSGYSLLLDYRRAVVPSLSEADADWVQQRLGHAKPG